MLTWISLILYAFKAKDNSGRPIVEITTTTVYYFGLVGSVGLVGWLVGPGSSV